MKYIVSVDSGGSKTEAIAYDLDGKAIARAQTGFGNLLIDKEKALNNLRKAVHQVLIKLGEESCLKIIMGISGIDSGGFREDILKVFPHWRDRITLMNDAWLSYYALVKESDGCLIICGTGSVCIGKKAEETYRVGGWGHLLGDEGSGYWLALEAMKQLLQQEDNKEPFSLLSLLLLSHLKQTAVTDMVKYVYTHSKDEIAALAEVVVKGAKLGDGQAVLLLKNAGKELAKQTELLLSRMELTGPITIGVSGSVLSKNDLVFEAYQFELQKKNRDLVFVRASQSSTIGGYYFYKKHFSS